MLHGSVITRRFILALGLFTQLAMAQDNVFRLNSGAIEPLSMPEGGFYNQIAEELFKRIDTPLKYISLPSERSLMHANKGIDDGNIARIAGIEKKWSNLVQVPETVIEWEFVAYTRDAHFQFTGWDSLKGHKVGFIRGWQIYERNSGRADESIRAVSPEQLFGLLTEKRVDVILFERWQGSYWLKKLGINARRVEPSISLKPLYIYLHNSRKEEVDRIQAALKSMKEDGSYERIFQSVFPDR